MKDYFHEAKVALENAQREYTDVSSLTAIGAYAINQAVENSVRAIWCKATGNDFPYEKFQPFHKPVSDIKKIGFFDLYSAQSQVFLEQLNGMALDEVRFENSQAYKDHTKPKNINRGKKLIAGTLVVIQETEQLSESKKAIDIIKKYESNQQNIA